MTPARTMFLTAVRRKSWKSRPATPAALQAETQDFLNSATDLVVGEVLPIGLEQVGAVEGAFILIDGESLRDDHGDPAVEGDPYTEAGEEG